jgi:hypothetical protein
MSTQRSTSIKRAVLVLAAAGAAGAGIAAIATAGGADGGDRTISLAQRDESQKFVDVPPASGEEKPPSQGDVYILTNVVLDPKTNKVRGRTHSVCSTTVPGAKPIALCTGAIALSDGTILFAGPFPFTTPTATLAVTGGTGAYAGARGTFVYRDGAGDRSSFEVHLIG